MANYLLFLALYSIGIHSPQKPVQTADAIDVSGICSDATTSVYLLVEAFAMSGTTKVKLGQSDGDGKFSFLLPLSATSVSFACPGYSTVTLPVTFVNNPGNGTKFRFGIIMGKRDSLAVRQTDQLILNNELPDHTDIKYAVGPIESDAGLPLVTTAHGNRVAAGFQFTFKKGRMLPLWTVEGARPGLYRVVASIDGGPVLIDKTFTVNEGLTSMAIRADEPAQPTSASPANEKSRGETGLPASRIVYFDQSRYELTTVAKASLDSIARMLLTQQQVVAHITGYTDNVGEQKRNMTLSEYRAKIAANYLKQRGIPEAQLLIDWKGDQSPTVLGDSEEMKAKNRRVIIQFDRN